MRDNKLKILKSLAKNISEKQLDKLAEILAEKYQEILPISFYSLTIRLYAIFKNVEKMLQILNIFAKNKNLYKGLTNYNEDIIGFRHNEIVVDKPHRERTKRYYR